MLGWFSGLAGDLLGPWDSLQPQELPELALFAPWTCQAIIIPAVSLLPALWRPECILRGEGESQGGAEVFMVGVLGGHLH